jgi:hypothetical protein
MRKALGEVAWGVIVQNRAKAHGAADEIYEILDFGYLGQLGELMKWSQAWDLFRDNFRDRRHLEDLLVGITPVRNDRAHFRRVPEDDLDRCRLQNS